MKSSHASHSVGAGASSDDGRVPANSSMPCCISTETYIPAHRRPIGVAGDSGDGDKGITMGERGGARKGLATAIDVEQDVHSTTSCKRKLDAPTLAILCAGT